MEESQSSNRKGQSLQEFTTPRQDDAPRAATRRSVVARRARTGAERLGDGADGVRTTVLPRC